MSKFIAIIAVIIFFKWWWGLTTDAIDANKKQQPVIEAPRPKLYISDDTNNKQLNGYWDVDMQGLSYTITLYTENNRLMMDRIFNDGSSYTKEMVMAQDSRIEEKGGNAHGEWFLIDALGDLQLWTDTRLTYNAKKLNPF